MTGKPLFILIDDDAVHLFIQKTLIVKELGGSTIAEFNSGEDGLAYIERNFTKDTDRFTILLLDINMPVMNAWQFLDRFAKFDEAIRRQIRVAVLSSSLDFKDKKRAAQEPDVYCFLEKPLTIDGLHKVLERKAS